jgi:hypothetical protein
MSTEPTIVRTPIFEAHTYKKLFWSSEMLTAIKSAQKLGVTNFELSVSDDPIDVPQYETDSRSDLNWALSSKRQIGTTRVEASKLIVYAVRVE